MKLGELKDKSVLILGLGREGIDSFKFLRKLFPKKILGIADKNEKVDQSCLAKLSNQKNKLYKLYLGKNYLKALKDYDVIIKSPGVPIHLPEIEKAFKEGKITSQAEIFFDNWPPEPQRRVEMKANSEGGKLHRPGKIIGITGTKGKGTTSSLIYRILKEGGFKAYLVGNIEKPVLSTLFKAKANDIFVYELSSHQLYNLKKGPQIAVFLNLFAAHLDYYKNFKEYQRAKENITLHQTKKDYFIYNSEQKELRGFLKKTKAKKIPIPTNYEYLTNIRIPLIGKFNLKNVMAAVAVGELFNIPKKKIREAIKSFKPLSHRLEFVGKYKGIEFYNDSLATVPEATIAAIDALSRNVQTIILGGFNSNVDYKKLAKRVLESGIKTVILFPPSGQKMWENICQKSKGRKLPEHSFVNNMKDAVKLAYQYTKRGKICLLSCASPSYGIFKNYKERGNLFKRYAKKYGKRLSSS